MLLFCQVQAPTRCKMAHVSELLVADERLGIISPPRRQNGVDQRRRRVKVRVVEGARGAVRESEQQPLASQLERVVDDREVRMHDCPRTRARSAREALVESAHALPRMAPGEQAHARQSLECCLHVCSAIVIVFRSSGICKQ